MQSDANCIEEGTQEAQMRIISELNPVGKNKGKLRQIAIDNRLRQKFAAWVFKVDGIADGPCPYGNEWNREYTPYPYPEARPEDISFYEGTGIGALYGAQNSDHHLWQTAGWNIVRKGVEFAATPASGGRKNRRTYLGPKLLGWSKVKVYNRKVA